MEYIFDAHAHYDDERFDPDGARNEVLGRIFDAGVRGIVNDGVDLATSYRSAALARQYPGVYFAAGYHPHEAADFSENFLPELHALWQHEQCVAVGEIGLDYYYDFADRAIQKSVFGRQLAIANELDMPVVIHSRDAAEDTLNILRQYRPKGLVHCFTYSPEVAQQLCDMGLFIGITGMVTFKNAKKILRVVEQLPLSRMVIETDCPYMTPEPHRGQRNDSSLLSLVAQKIAQIKGETADTVLHATFDNACALYNIDAKTLREQKEPQ